MYLDSKFRIPIKVDAANVFADAVNVPVYLSGAGASLQYAIANSFRADGSDLVITTTDDILIPFDRFVFSKAGGILGVVYRDPIQSIVDGGTSLLLQGGGELVNVASSPVTWQNNYDGVIDHVLGFHGEEVSGNLIDFTGNYTTNTSNIGAYVQTGQIENSPLFNGNNSQVSTLNFTHLNSLAGFTIQIWIKPTASNVVDYLAYFPKDGNNRIELYTHSNGNMYFAVHSGGVTYVTLVGYATSFPAGQLRLLSAVFNGTAGYLKIFSNVTDLSTVLTGIIPATTANMGSALTFKFGISDGTAFGGLMDEIKVLNGSLSIENIQGQYDNQNGFSTNAVLEIGDVDFGDGNFIQHYYKLY